MKELISTVYVIIDMPVFHIFSFSVQFRYHFIGQTQACICITRLFTSNVHKEKRVMTTMRCRILFMSICITHISFTYTSTWFDYMYILEYVLKA